MTAPPPTRVAVIGLGFMGRTHLPAYRAAEAAGFPVRLVAACDTDMSALARPTPGNLRSAFDPSLLTGVDVVRDHAELLARPDIDAVSICTPTDTHVEVALAALAGGKHALIEKPVALTAAEVRRVADAADNARRVCMPAMVMRFWPGWTWLKDRIADDSLGPLRSLYLERLGSRPAWNRDFYDNPARSGGALVDLHVHDADFILWCLGMPDSVASTGTFDQVTTAYRYRRAGAPTSVVATAGWHQSPSLGFRMRFLANFEHATAEFDLTRAHRPLIVADAREQRAIPLDPGSAYHAEVRHFLECVRADSPPRVSLGDAIRAAELLDAEAVSLSSGAAVSLPSAK